MRLKYLFYSETKSLEGHEAIIILNCNKQNAEIMADICLEDKNLIKDIKLIVTAERVKYFRMDHPNEIGGLRINRLVQYALKFRSNIEVIIQYGRWMLHNLILLILV